MGFFFDIMYQMQKNNPVLSILNVLVLCIIVSAVSIFFIYQTAVIGFVLVALSVLCLFSLKLFQINISSTKPDVIFGIIDNGILAVMAVYGGEIAGVAGAIAGGVVGNAITDGIAGIFEGYWAERSMQDHRTVLGSAVGKMSGCLLGAGIVLAGASILGA
jgi:hypothetical protein